MSNRQKLLIGKQFKQCYQKYCRDLLYDSHQNILEIIQHKIMI